MVLSWVAISTVVPVRLIRSSSSMMSALVSGSRLPVGSSASSNNGRLANARAIATRCCSPPDSSCGSRLALPSRPTISSTSGTTCLIEARERPITSRANPTFCSTVLLVSNRKSWNTQPRRRRWAATFDRRRCTRSWPSTSIDPEVGMSSRISRRRKVDLPDPDGPMTKANSPFSTSMVTSSRAGLVEAL